VELGGLIVEHEHGARGEFQQVLSVSWLPVCWGCGGPAGSLGRYVADERGRVGRDTLDGRIEVGPSCGTCGEQVVPVSEVTGMVGASCKLADDGVGVDTTRVVELRRRRGRRRLALLGAVVSCSALWLAVSVAFGGLGADLGSGPGSVAGDVVAGRPLDREQSVVLSRGAVTVVAHVDDRDRCWKVVVDSASYLASVAREDVDDLTACAGAVRRDGPGTSWDQLVAWLHN
jgi:hypothetical protein